MKSFSKEEVSMIAQTIETEVKNSGIGEIFKKEVLNDKTMVQISITLLTQIMDTIDKNLFFIVIKENGEYIFRSTVRNHKYFHDTWEKFMTELPNVLKKEFN